MSLCNRMAEERRQQSLCDKNFVRNIILPDPFAKDQNTVILSEDHDKTCKKWPWQIYYTQLFCHPLPAAILLRKLTNNCS